MAHHADTTGPSSNAKTFLISLLAIIIGSIGVLAGLHPVAWPLGMVLIAIAVLLLISDYSLIHNAVVEDQEKVEQAWSDIEVLLQQQQDMLTQLEETVEQATELC